MRLMAEKREAPKKAAAPAKAPRNPRRRSLWRRYGRWGTLGVAVMALGGIGFMGYRFAEHDLPILQDQFIGWTASFGLAVADIQVEGRSSTSPEAILRVVGARRGTPTLAVNPAQAKAQLETLPWIKSATVERRLPDTIYIRIVERTPVALWQRQGKLVLIDREGDVIPVDKLENYSQFVVLVGDDAPAEAGKLLDMLKTEPALASHVTAAIRMGGRRWNLKLDRGIEVALPETNPEAAWRQLAQYEKTDGLLQRNIERVDLRLPDRLVVRVIPEPTKKPAAKGKPTGKST